MEVEEVEEEEEEEEEGVDEIRRESMQRRHWVEVVQVRPEDRVGLGVESVYIDNIMKYLFSIEHLYIVNDKYMEW